MATQVCVVGTIATDPKEYQYKPDASLCTFRLASSERRLNKETNAWEDGPTNWYSINVFRALATNTMTSFRKGDRVIVSGKLRVKSWQKDDRSGTSVEIDAEALGHELKWGTTVFTKSTAPGGTPSTGPGSQETETSTELTEHAQPLAAHHHAPIQTSETRERAASAPTPF